MKLTNLYENITVAFKIKVNLQNESRVTPSRGLLKPGETTKFIIRILSEKG